ncbi:MAG: hypothetical protein H6654_16700 [Ardenticatenaceae bacterium]|nr:hypothetical protein [Anaerolineales bacterium]MCB8939715.1 hypothetical protein [Ardenticatenaceae bacterium]MCB8975201.1 hypothetical protein [Ardenticatenaceae bacterium]
MNFKFKIFRDPTLQFIISLLVAPLFAILGTSVGTAGAALPLSLAGWLVTLIIWSFFAIRSARHQWRQLPRAPFSPVDLRLRMGITFFAVVVVVTAVVVAVLLIMALIR